MSYLLDTNILLRSTTLEDPLSKLIVGAIERLIIDNQELYIAPQNLIELWNVFTRPVSSNGFGKTISEAALELERLKNTFTLLEDCSSVYTIWEQLVREYEVKGVNVHDTRLVAFMQVHNIDRLLTLNTKDFQRFNSIITLVHPEDI